MLIIPQPASRDTCDGLTRRDLLRVGSLSLAGLSLAQLAHRPALGGDSQRKSFGAAQSVILLYLQGGPSHIDLWDPKDDAPEKVRSVFKSQPTKLPGVHFTELLPRLAQAIDKATLIRSMSYSPNGLFNHTAAIYQMLTGYTTDKVSPSGQLEPPSPKDFPTVGSNIVRFKPVSGPSLPFVMMPRPLQESNVIGKGGTAGFLGKAYDPYLVFPPGDDFDPDKMDRVQVDDLKLREDVSVERMQRRAALRETIARGMPELERAVSKHELDAYYGQALGLVLSGKARDAFDLGKEPAKLRERYGKTTFGQCCLLARRLIEAGTRFVEVNWPRTANSDRHSWDVHVDLSKRMKNEAAPMFDAGIATLLEDLDDRGLLGETLVVAVGEFGRSPQRGVSTSGNANSEDGRDHWPYCYTALLAGGGVRRGFVYSQSDKTGSAPLEHPVHPGQLLATIYHCVGIRPDTIIHNHLNQPRELVQAEPVDGILA